MSLERIKFELPSEKRNLLLHSCCAPCVGDIMETLVYSDIKFTIYFYNPNIHPQKEYLIRKDENKRFADKLNIEFIDADYDRDLWFQKAKGMEMEPERGIRCSMCFDMRFLHTAEYAAKNNFDVISSSLGISRWKDFDQINRSGLFSVAQYPELEYWTINWRKHGGSKRMLEISKQENFYQQEYCGCAYSLRDTNNWRVANGREKIQIGKKFYGQEDKQ